MNEDGRLNEMLWPVKKRLIWFCSLTQPWLKLARGFPEKGLLQVMTFDTEEECRSS